MKRSEIIKNLKRVNVVIICVILFVFPLLFLVNTTDPYILPKQIFLAVAVSLSLLIWAISAVYYKKIILRTNPFILPLGLFSAVILASAVLSRNAYDSIAMSIPVVATFFLFLVIVNTVSERKEFIAVVSSLLLGAAISTIVSILNYFQIYFLPIPAAQSRYFSTLGSPVQHLIYIIPLLIMTGFALMGEVKRRRLNKNYEGIFYGILGAIFLVGTAVILFQIAMVSQKPTLLPYTYGFQIAAATISQDSSRLLLSLPLGSGYGTFFTDYTRFRLADINSNNTLWNFPFTYSSSLALELLTTTGVLGFLAFIFIILRVLRNRVRAASPIFLSLITIFALSFFLPFSFASIFLMSALLSIYTTFLCIAADKRTDMVSVSLVAFKEGLFSVEESAQNPRPSKTDSIALPLVLTVIILVVCGYASYLATMLLFADTKIVSSLSAANQSNGQKVYDLQRQALIQFPYRSDYYRIFSQVNLGLANSVANAVPKGSSPSAQTQQTISQLLQQSVGNARTAVALAPVTAVNWENLGQIYRSLIGTGQNADQFAIASLNQAIILDPQNPLLRIELGGIFYQLQNYDAAQNQFQIAVNLKPDFANAYYNLGHALEQKGDYKNALAAYQAALSLIQNDKNSKQQLEKEIDAVSKKVGQAGQNQASNPAANNQAQSQLQVNQTTPVPTQGTQVKVSPPPGITTTPSPTPGK